MSDPATVGLILTGIGSVLGFMGGRKQDARFAEMAEAQYEADKINYEFSWQESQDAYTYQLESIDIAQWNLDQQRVYRDKLSINEWIDKDKQRIFDYNNQVDAYNAGMESYRTQLDFNVLADQMTKNAARRAYQDKLTLMGFQLEDIDRTVGIKERGVALSRRDIAAQVLGRKKETLTSKELLKTQLEGRRSELATKLEQQRITGIESEGQIRALGQTGRSGRKNRYRVLQASQRLEDAIFHAQNSVEVTTDLNIRAINEKLESFSDRMDIQDETLLEDLYNTRVEGEFGIRQLSDQLKSTNLEYEFSKEKLKLDKYSADLQATSRLKPTPKLPPMLSKPLEMPEPKLQKPRAPRKGPKPRKYAPSQGHGLAGLASGMQSFGSALAGFT